MVKVFSTRRHLIIVRRIPLFSQEKGQRTRLYFSSFENGNVMTISGIFFSFTISKLPPETMDEINKLKKK